MWEYYCKVLRVIDGDSFEVSIDLGFFTHKRVSVRLYGIDTPETRTRDASEKKRGFEAKARVKELFDAADYIVLKSHGIGKFGRCLGELKLTIGDNTLNLTDLLIDEKLGKPYFGGKRS